LDTSACTDVHDLVSADSRHCQRGEVLLGEVGDVDEVPRRGAIAVALDTRGASGGDSERLGNDPAQIWAAVVSSGAGDCEGAQADRREPVWFAGDSGVDELLGGEFGPRVRGGRPDWIGLAQRLIVLGSIIFRIIATARSQR
jgi:hypothetical protein